MLNNQIILKRILSVHYKWTLVLLAIGIGLWIIKETALTGYVVGVFKVKLHFWTYAKYLCVSVFSTFGVLVVVSSSGALLITVKYLARENYLQMATLLGKNIKRIFGVVSICFIGLILLICILNEFLFKEYAARAELIFEDDILASVDAPSKISLANNKFLRFTNGEQLYFSSLIFDPADAEAPVLQSPLLVKREPVANDTEIIRFAKRGVLTGNKLNLKGDEYIITKRSNAGGRASTVFGVEFRSNISSEHDLGAIQVKNLDHQGTSFATLKFSEFLRLRQIAKFFDINSETLVWGIAFNFIVMILLPLVFLSISWLLIRASIEEI